MYFFSNDIIYKSSYIYLFVVGIDIEIKFKPGNREEDVKESMSEENCNAESPLKNFPSPPLKKVLY